MKLCVLITLFVAGAAELQWEQFSLGSRADITVDFSEMDKERMFVRYPCSANIWFKLFISSGHIELFSKTEGNIFCKEGGNKDWYSGDRTDFTMKNVGCDKTAIGDEYVVFVFEKTTTSLQIKNRDKVVYTKSFGDLDGLCSTTPTTKIITQVWDYTGNLGLSVLDNFFGPDPVLTSSGSTSALEGCLVHDFDFTGTDILATDDVDSAGGCLELCSRLSGQDGCKSMAFDEATGSCHLKTTQNGANPRPRVGIVSGNLACARLYASSDAVFTCATFGLKSAEGKWLSAQADGSVEWNRDWYRPWEMISFEPSESDPSTGYFRSTHGKYLSAQADLKTLEWNRDWMRPWEEFTVEQVGDKVAIKSTKWGLYISSEPAQQDTSELFSVHPPECLRSFIPPTTAPATASPNVM